jgi:hypothetical protein
MSYGKVHDAYWESETIDALSDRAALLGLFLISGPHRNAIGCFKLGMGAITDNPRFGGWGIEGVSKALRELEEGGFIAREPRTGWTFIRNALKHDPIKGLKAAIHAAKLVCGVPRNLSFYSELLAKASEQIEVERDGKDLIGYPFEPPSMPHPSPLPLPEPSPKPTPPAAPNFEVEFEGWWKVYPRHEDRGHAFKAFRAVRKSGVELETLTAGAQRYRDLPGREAKFTKLGATWLNGQCWSDETAVATAPEKFTPQEAKDAMRHMTYAAMIKKGRSPGQYFSNTDRSRMIAAGMVTMEECEKAGCAA